MMAPFADLTEIAVAAPVAFILGLVVGLVMASRFKVRVVHREEGNGAAKS